MCYYKRTFFVTCGHSSWDLSRPVGSPCPSASLSPEQISPEAESSSQPASPCAPMPTGFRHQALPDPGAEAEAEAEAEADVDPKLPRLDPREMEEMSLEGLAAVLEHRIVMVSCRAQPQSHPLHTLRVQALCARCRRVSAVLQQVRRMLRGMDGKVEEWRRINGAKKEEGEGEGEVDEEQETY